MTRPPVPPVPPSDAWKWNRWHRCDEPLLRRCQAPPRKAPQSCLKRSGPFRARRDGETIDDSTYNVLYKCLYSTIKYYQVLSYTSMMCTKYTINTCQHYGFYMFLLMLLWLRSMNLGSSTKALKPPHASRSLSRAPASLAENHHPQLIAVSRAVKIHGIFWRISYY